MSQQFLLACECGHEIEVQTRNAGESRPCEACDRVIDIPTLREIRNLPPATTETSSAPRNTDGWTLGRGITFALAVPTLLVSLVVFAYSRNMEGRMHMDSPSVDQVLKSSTDAFLSADIDNMTLNETWNKIWKPIRAESLLIRRTPYHIMAKERRETLKKWMIGTGALGGLSLLAIAATLLLPHGKK